MITLSNIERQLLNHEGLKLRAYLCPAGKLTIGIGRNLDDKGISEAEAIFLLRNDIAECREDLKKIFQNWDALDEIRQNVLIDMRFNLGASGFRKFTKLIVAVKNEDFKAAAKEMRQSKWFDQVGRRGTTLFRMMFFGE